MLARCRISYVCVGKGIDNDNSYYLPVFIEFISQMSDIDGWLDTIENAICHITNIDKSIRWVDLMDSNEIAEMYGDYHSFNKPQIDRFADIPVEELMEYNSSDLIDLIEYKNAPITCGFQIENLLSANDFINTIFSFTADDYEEEKMRVLANSEGLKT